MTNEVHNIELRSEEVQEILTRVPSWMIRWGNTLIFILIALLLIMSWLIKYPDIIETEALITTEIPPQQAFAKVTSRIDSIYVQDFQFVDGNSVLAVLENSANANDVFYLQSLIDTITIERDKIEIPIYKLSNLVLGEVSESFARFENSYLQYALNQRLKPYKNEMNAYQNSLIELNVRLQNLKSQYEIKKSELELKKNNLNRNEKLLEKGVISNQEFENEQLNYFSEQRSYRNLGASISQLKESIITSKRNSEDSNFSWVEDEMNLLSLTVQSLNQLKTTIKDWENRYVLKSEISGKVSFLDYWSTNQNVSSGDLVFTIVAENHGGFVVRLKAPAENSGKISKGQTINVKLRNYPETEFGILRGKIEKISLATNKDGFYLIKASLYNGLVTSYGKTIDFKQEMIGSAEIITEDLRLLERFFYKLKNLVDR